MVDEYRIGNPPVSFERFIEKVSEAVRILSEMPCFQDSNYGYLSILKRGEAVFTREIGNCLPDKTAKYFLLSREGVVRLSENQGRFSSDGGGDFLSWQSRDPEARIYGQPSGGPPWGKLGGAITPCSDFFVSYAGFPNELGNEAAMVYACYEVGWLSFEAVQSLKRISNNPFIDGLLSKALPQKVG